MSETELMQQAVDLYQAKADALLELRHQIVEQARMASQLIDEDDEDYPVFHRAEITFLGIDQMILKKLGAK